MDAGRRHHGFAAGVGGGRRFLPICVCWSEVRPAGPGLRPRPCSPGGPRVGLQHGLQQRPQGLVDARQVGHLARALITSRCERPILSGSPPHRLGDHEAEAVDVRARADIAAVQAELLGRDVVQLAGEAAPDDRAFRQRRAGDAEIDDLGAMHLAAGDQHVVGREVAVDDPEIVSASRPVASRWSSVKVWSVVSGAWRSISDSPIPSTYSIAR